MTPDASLAGGYGRPPIDPMQGVAIAIGLLSAFVLAVALFSHLM